MRPWPTTTVLMLTLTLLLLMPVMPAMAGDMRIQSIQAREKQAELLGKARQEKKRAAAEAEALRQSIMADRESLTAAVEQLRADNRRLSEENSAMTGELNSLIERREELRAAVHEQAERLKEITGFARAMARNAAAVIERSPRTALDTPLDAPDIGNEKRNDLFPQTLSGREGFPGIDELRRLFFLMGDEIKAGGQVRLRQGEIIDRGGRKTGADILMAGAFTLTYRTRKETGFLLYSPTSNQLFALSRVPSWLTQRQIKAYMAGRSPAVPMDISGGAAIRQLSHRPGFSERISSGGPLVWPILAIFVLALLIVAERMLFLIRTRVDADSLMESVNQSLRGQRLTEALRLCEQYRTKPIARVLAAGLRASKSKIFEMENALQESILREIPRLERFLSSLGMLATIAPLLGLLGTVTGMINTFHAITFFGAGDAGMMSGGISEALVTTMLGLSVAIPIMLCHALLSRQVENVIARMEEKAVSLVNTVSKIKEEACSGR